MNTMAATTIYECRRLLLARWSLYVIGFDENELNTTNHRMNGVSVVVVVGDATAVAV